MFASGLDETNQDFTQKISGHPGDSRINSQPTGHNKGPLIHLKFAVQLKTEGKRENTTTGRRQRLASLIFYLHLVWGLSLIRQTVMTFVLFSLVYLRLIDYKHQKVLI